MTNVAFCDDDSAVLRELRSLLEQYRADRNEELDCAMFHSPLELIHSMERGAGFDILFLDVLMPGVNGIDTASEIRCRFVKHIGQ